MNLPRELQKLECPHAAVLQPTPDIPFPLDSPEVFLQILGWLLHRYDPDLVRGLSEYEHPEALRTICAIAGFTTQKDGSDIFTDYASLHRQRQRVLERAIRLIQSAAATQDRGANADDHLVKGSALLDRMATSHLPGLMEFEARSLFDPDTQRLVKLERQRLGNLPRSSVSIATLDRDLEQLLIAEQRLLEELRQLRSKFTYKPDDDSSAIYRHFGPVVNGLESSLKQFLAIFPNEIEPWLETAPAADSRALSVAVASAFSTCQQLQKVLDVFTASKHYHESLQESLENMEREYESLSAETLPQPSADSPAPAFGHLVARMFSEIETCTAILNRRQA